MFRRVKLGILAIAALAAAPALSAVIVTVEAAGLANTTIGGFTSYGIANLDNATNGLPSVNFTGSSITGTTTSGFVNIGGANVYGGAGGTGSYGTVQGDPATIQLSQSVNYFGIWGSALDGNNSIALYNGNTLVGSYALQSTLQSASNFSNAYYGNPFGGGNTGEMYAFFNFMSDTAFNRVQIIQNGGGGFEFDNLTVGNRAMVSTAPEPGTWALMLLGFGAVGWAMRRRGLSAGPKRTRLAA